MNELTDALVTRLNVDERQARGGAGVLFRAARDRLGAAEFDQLVGDVPGVRELLRAAPSPSGGGLLGGLASALGGNSALLASVMTGFDALGLTRHHAKQFVPVILEHLRAHAGQDRVERLERALRSRGA